MVSGGPNFIFDHCVDKINAEQCEGLDLSSWNIAFNGAEPIRSDTLDRFAEKFAPFGFRSEAFLPCYGLAEATLIVSGGPSNRPPLTASLDKEAMKRGRANPPSGPEESAAAVVGCGVPVEDHEVAIVDPHSLARCLDGAIGEIWISGPSVAQGYWQQAEKTQTTFHARLEEEPQRYLRTGDLGFLRDGQLFVTGRLKDLLIIDGLNVYPQDIEWTVGACHPAMRPHSGAAFTTDEAGRHVTVVHEIERNGRDCDVSAAIETIRRAISQEHELAVRIVALVKVGGVPRTSSGKIQRRRCRELFLEGSLPIVAQWTAPERDRGGISPAASADLGSRDFSRRGCRTVVGRRHPELADRKNCRAPRHRRPPGRR